MTLVTDMGVDVAPSGPLSPVRRSLTSRWRFAARLARREVRHRPGRSALVAGLVALPVIGMAGASTWQATLRDTSAGAFARRAGSADVRVQTFRSVTGGIPNVVDELPFGARWLSSQSAFVPVRTATGHVAQVQLTDLDLSDPLTNGIVDITDGHPPGAGEVLLDAGTAARFDVKVGDDLVLDRPDVTWRVAGIGRASENHTTPLAVVGEFDFDRIRPDARNAEFLILLADQSRADAVADRLAGIFGERTIVESAGRSVAVTDEGPRLQSLAWGWVAGTIALAAMGVIIAAAFATTARRQLVTIGQLTANGASGRLIRRALALQGAWTGLAGAAAGVAIAVGGSVAGHGFAERIANRSIGPVAVSPLQLAVVAATAIIAATVAALIPARVASRVPVLVALAGRRPLTRARRRLAPWAIVSSIVGLVLLGGAAARGHGGNIGAATATVGGLCLLAGLCTIAPLAVDGFDRIPARAAWRLTLRGLTRQRPRTAGIITAIAVVGAIACAAGTVAARIVNNGNAYSRVPTLPANTVTASTPGNVGPSQTITAINPANPVVADIDKILPSAHRTTWSIPSFPVGDHYFQQWGPESFVVADDAVLDVIGLSTHDRHALDTVGALTFDNWGSPIAPVNQVDITVPTATGDTTVHAAQLRDPPKSWGGGLVQVLITPARVAQLGWDTVPGTIVWRNDRDLTAAQRRALDDATAFTDIDSVYDDLDTPNNDTAATFVQFERPTFEATQLQAALVVIGAALLLTLLVVAIGLSLAATDSRDEHDVLVATGASPALLRRLSARRALTMTVTAAVLAIPTGYLPMLVIVLAADDETAAFPFLTALGLLVGIPLTATGATWLASTVNQRLHPPQVSALTFE